jgi:hypothetical protein
LSSSLFPADLTSSLSSSLFPSDLSSSLLPSDATSPPLVPTIYVVPTTNDDEIVIPETDDIQEYCEEKSMKEIADISMTPIEDRFFNQMSASDILQTL